jgi:ABC-type molybdenum transport system ATPase subunit/photorepair protein PhrA
MPTSADQPELSELQGLRARLTPGALLYVLADAAQAAQLRDDLRQDGLAWLGWPQRQAFMQAWRPAAQERYSSMAGRDAPTVRDWLSPLFKRWVEGPDQISTLNLDPQALNAAIRLCGLEGLAKQPVSLLSNGEAARACLAAALAQEPKILVLHDLAEGLDKVGRQVLLALGRRLAGQGHAVLFIASRPSLFPQAVLLPSHPDFSSEPGPGPEIFRCKNLGLEAGERPLFKALDWQIHGGEAWWLHGANGQGKSTLLAFLSGEHPQAWARSWSLLGKGRGAYTPLAALRSQVAWVSPELAATARQPILDLLDRALNGPARLLLLDEVLRGLDEASLAQWQRRVDAWMGPDKALVFVCHDPLEAPGCLNRQISLD